MLTRYRGAARTPKSRPRGAWPAGEDTARPLAGQGIAGSSLGLGAGRGWPDGLLFSAAGYLGRAPAGPPPSDRALRAGSRPTPATASNRGVRPPARPCPRDRAEERGAASAREWELGPDQPRADTALEATAFVAALWPVRHRRHEAEHDSLVPKPALASVDQALRRCPRRGSSASTTSSSRYPHDSWAIP